MTGNKQNMNRVLVVSEQPGWVCRRLADLLLRIPGVEVTDSKSVVGVDKNNIKIVYYLPYLEHNNFSMRGPVSIALMTHSVPGSHEERYNRIASSVDHCVVLSSKYWWELKERIGQDKLSLIFPPAHQLCKVEPLRVGWFHRSPPGYGKRKRQEWIEALRRESWIEIVESGGRLSTFDLYAKMRKCDVVLITSQQEGGPLSLVEALASGVPVLIGEGVGLQQDFEEHPAVHTFDVDSYDSMRGKLWGLYEPRMFCSKSVELFSEDNWIQKHKELFQRISDEKH